MNQIQEIVDMESVSFGAEVTVKFAVVIPKGYTHMTPEELFKEWFSDKFGLNLRTNGHAFRDGSLVGNSEEVLSVEIIRKTVIDPNLPEGQMCMEENCNKPATKDYNHHGHWVCNRHYDKLNNEFDEEYD